MIDQLEVAMPPEHKRRVPKKTINRTIMESKTSLILIVAPPYHNFPRQSSFSALESSSVNGRLTQAKDNSNSARSKTA